MEIKPEAFRSRPSARRSRGFKRIQWIAGLVLAVFFFLLGAAGWFVFTARQLTVQIEPQPDSISIGGALLAPRLGAYYLLRPGQYTLQARRRCYQPLVYPFEVPKEKNKHLELTLEKLPGRLSLQVHSSARPAANLKNALVFIDGKAAGRTPLNGLPVKPGRRQVEIRAENFQILKTDLSIDGCGRPQAFNLALTPNWSEITIASVPPGALIRINGRQAGKTPVTLKLAAGTYKLTLSAARFKTLQARLVVEANRPQVLDDFRLQPADGTLQLQTDPPGANVTLAKAYVGQTPLKIRVAPGIRHTVHLFKAGYQKATRRIRVASAGTRKLIVKLTPIRGIVHLTVKPADATLYIDGQAQGPGVARLHLLAVPHTLEIKKNGYKSFRKQIIPRPGFPQTVKISLAKIAPAAPRPLIKARNGYVLKLIYPHPFTMGSSRRQQGRRSNETLRRIDLKRPFYMGLKEVTNQQFRQFLASHDSGAFKGQSLNRDAQPVVRVSWQQAARFCNWLSAAESLPPAYIEKNGRLAAAEPPGPGYRLPTEAEWEYCARFSKTGRGLKYPWGDRFPPPAKSVNIADIAARDLLPTYLKDYNDGFAVAAPPGAFKPNLLGLYDLGGNVAEWCHDYYTIYPYLAGRIYRDPSGPQQGKFRVVRGSSWKQSGITALRVSYRDYSDRQRPDLGFRICRYIKVKAPKSRAPADGGKAEK